MEYSTKQFKLALLPLAITLACSSNVNGAEQEQAQIVDNRKIEVISVTAQKRIQNLQEVPVAITNISSEDIARHGFDSAADIQFQTPGLIVSYSSTNAIPNFTIRGVGLNDFTAVQSSPIAIHVDDVYFGSSTLLNFSLFDVEHVEVLKGPQGTLYGRNSTGGAVNFFTNKPSQDFQVGGSVNVANYNSFTTEGFVSGGLTETVSARLSIYNTDQGSGAYSHPVHGEVGKKDKIAGRLQFLWEPSDNFDARMIIFGGKDQSDGNQYQGLVTYTQDGSEICAPINNNDLSFSGQQQCYSLANPGIEPVQSVDGDPFTLQSGIINRDDIEVIGTSLALNYEFDDMLLSSVTSYNSADRVSQEDADGTTLRAIDVGYETHFTQYSEELRLASLSPQALEWTMGLYLSSDSLETPRTETDLSDIFGGFRQNHAYQLDTDSVAIFSHNEYHIDDELSVVAGLRYTYENRAFKGGTLNVESGSGPSDRGDFVPSPTPVPDYNDAGAFDEAYINEDVTFKKWSWRLGLNYNLSDNSFVYGSISNGFKSGGFVGDITNQTVLENPYDEETLTAFDAGIKSDLLDKTLRWNNSIFYYDYQDVILAVDVIQDGEGELNTLFTNDNVSDADVFGFESDLVWLPADDWEIRLAGTYLDTKQTQTKDVVQKIDGSELLFAPKLSANFSIRYTSELTDDITGSFQVSGTTRSSHYAEAESVPIAKIDGYSLLNANFLFTPTDGDWSVSVWAKNLTDKEYTTYINDLRGLGTVLKTPGMPRTFGVKISYNFY